MVSYEKALNLVKENNPNTKIRSSIEQEDLYIFEFEPTEDNTLFDTPLYNMSAVRKDTGEYIDVYDPIDAIINE